MKSNRIFMVLIIGLMIVCGCGSSYETVQTKIVRSKIAYLATDTISEEDFPPRGVMRGRPEEDTSGLTDRRFLKAADTIFVEQAAKPLHIATAVYPAEAHARYMEGTVWIRLWITSDGIVKRAKVEESTDVIFNDSALEAGMNSRFKSAIKDNQPVAVSVYLPFHYKLK